MFNNDTKSNILLFLSKRQKEEKERYTIIIQVLSIIIKIGSFFIGRFRIKLKKVKFSTYTREKVP